MKSLLIVIISMWFLYACNAGSNPDQQIESFPKAYPPAESYPHGFPEHPDLSHLPKEV